MNEDEFRRMFIRTLRDIVSVTDVTKRAIAIEYDGGRLGERYPSEWELERDADGVSISINTPSDILLDGTARRIALLLDDEVIISVPMGDFGIRRAPQEGEIISIRPRTERSRNPVNQLLTGGCQKNDP